MRICQYIKLIALLTHQARMRRPTPSDGKSDGGICPTYDTECSKVPNMVIVCHCKQKSEITVYKSKNNEEGPKNKHTDNQFH